MVIKVKYKINLHGFELYRISEDEQLYKLTHSVNAREYVSKRVRPDSPRKRWKINQKWVSFKQLKPHLVFDDMVITDVVYYTDMEYHKELFGW